MQLRTLDPSASEHPECGLESSMPAWVCAGDTRPRVSSVARSRRILCLATQDQDSDVVLWLAAFRAGGDDRFAQPLRREVSRFSDSLGEAS